MTRELVDGVPVWRNAAGDLFLYSQDLTAPLVKVGTKADGFAADWSEQMAPHLEAYRASIVPRVRPTGKKN
jgi:hypothetical protein